MSSFKLFDFLGYLQDTYNAIQLLFGKPMTIFIESEQKNNHYILEWYESK